MDKMKRFLYILALLLALAIDVSAQVTEKVRQSKVVRLFSSNNMLNFNLADSIALKYTRDSSGTGTERRFVLYKNRKPLETLSQLNSGNMIIIHLLLNSGNIYYGGMANLFKFGQRLNANYKTLKVLESLASSFKEEYRDPEHGSHFSHVSHYSSH